MAFLDYTDISSYLPETADINYVVLVLGMIESYLNGLGFVFSLTANPTLRLYPKYDFQKDFRYLYFSNPTTVTIKSEEDVLYSKVLTIRKDYEFTTHHKIDTANYILTLKNQSLQYPYYLELNTNTGFTNKVPNDLKFAITEFVKQALNIQKAVSGVFDAEGQEIRSTSIGDISTTFLGANTPPTQDKIQELLQGNSGVMQIIKNYLPRK